MTFTVPSVPTFPTLSGLIFPVQRHLLSRTQSEEAYSGETLAYPQWSIPRYQYELGFSVLRSGTAGTDWQTLESFFKTVKFSAGCLFQFAFAEDSVATAQRFGTGDGSTVSFQLLRSFGTFTEPVYCPATITDIKDAGSVVSTASWDCDARGIVTFKGGYVPANTHALTWDGTFNWYCRFDDDDETFSNFMYTFWELQKVKFSTVKIMTS